jgi:hypothetical protein
MDTSSISWVTVVWLQGGFLFFAFSLWRDEISRLISWLLCRYQGTGHQQRSLGPSSVPSAVECSMPAIYQMHRRIDMKALGGLPTIDSRHSRVSDWRRRYDTRSENFLGCLREAGFEVGNTGRRLIHCLCFGSCDGASAVAERGRMRYSRSSVLKRAASLCASDGEVA